MKLLKEHWVLVLLAVFALLMVAASQCGCLGSKSKSESTSDATAAVNTTDAFIGTNESSNENTNEVVVNVGEEKETVVEAPKAWHEDTALKWAVILWVTYVLVALSWKNDLPWFGFSKDK